VTSFHQPLCTPRAARSELQRLQSAVGKTERATAAVLSDLRTVGRGPPKATELRAEVRFAQQRCFVLEGGVE
jgi:hypothetical protein